MLGFPTFPSTHFVPFLLATLLFRYTIAAVVQPADNFIQQPTERNASDPSASAVSSTDILNAPAGELHCVSRPSPPSPQSCLDAIKQIPDTDDPLRSPKSFFLNLPHRISSSDGRCVVRVGPGRQPRDFEIITGKLLRHLVNEVFSRCLVRHGQMGMIWEKGRAGNFYVLLEEFNPSKTRCADRRPDPMPSDCRAAIESIPWDTATRRFKESQPQHPMDVQLPELFVGEPRVKSTCMIILDTTGEDEGNWSLIGTTAVVIDAMCVKRGLMGWGSDLGLLFSTHPQTSAVDPAVKVHAESIFAYQCAKQVIWDVYRLL